MRIKLLLVASLMLFAFNIKAQWADVKIISLKCIKTEDWTGDDKIYIEVNGDKHDLGTFNNGDSRDIGLSFSFKHSICINLYEDDPDFLDGDDVLGAVCPDYDDKSANAAITSTIKYGMSGCKYQLTYIVY